MPLKTIRFITLMLAALSMGMAFCHLMEMPARLSWDQALWVNSTVHGGLYRMFGTLGAAIVVANVIACFALARMLRHHRRRVFLLTLAAAIVFALGLASWFAIVFPVNLELAKWLAGPVPADWADYRLRWESGHAVNAVLQMTGLALLLASVLAETGSHSYYAAQKRAEPHPAETGDA